MVKELNERLSANAQRLINSAFVRKPFGFSAVQQELKIGYFEAYDTIQLLLNENKVIKNEDAPWLFELSSS